MEYTIGTKIPSMPGWEIVRELGEGSYGKVFEVHKNNFDVTTKAALKLIRIPKSVSDIREAMSEGMDEQSVTTYFEGIVKRFVKEIAVMSELKSHPNIVACEDYVVEPHAGNIGWDILIRMELLTPLVNYQLKHPMNEEMVKRLAMDLCEALVFCQKKGLIHRDIKPANIFVDENGRFKLGDFGVARSAEKTMGGYSKQGTEIYMAPEVYLGRPYGATVDIYSLGLVLYRLMNGNRLPFYPAAPAPIEFSDRENALTARLRGEPMAPPCNASEEFAAVILKACAYESKDRYRTAAEMLEALKNIGKNSEKNSEKYSNATDDQEQDKVKGPKGHFVRAYYKDDKGRWYDKETWVPEENEESAGSVGFNFNRTRKDEVSETGDNEPIADPVPENDENIPYQDEESIGSIGISWGKKDADEIDQPGDEEQEDDHKTDDGGESEEHFDDQDLPGKQNAPELPLSISKIALPPLLFWISWMAIPIMMYVTKSEYATDNLATPIAAFAVNAAAVGTLMYLGVTLAKKEILIMYGACLGAALLCCVISVSMGRDFGMVAFLTVFLLVPAAALSMLLHYICKDKGMRKAAAGVGAVIIFAAQLMILWFG